jgi:hypothetical protein
MSIRAEYLSTYAKKNSGYNRRQMRLLIGHSAITRHIKIKSCYRHIYVYVKCAAHYRFVSMILQIQ